MNLLKAAPILAVLTLSFLVSLSATQEVKAVTIGIVEPAAGAVGAEIKLAGIIDTCGGDYRLFWDDVSDKTLLDGGKAASCSYVTTRFKVPETAGGKHKVILQDALTSVSSASEFSVIPDIFMTATEGYPGMTVTVSGSGFTAGEECIQLLYDGAIIKSDIVVSVLGSWKTETKIPRSIKGDHIIQASGPLTEKSQVGYLRFTVTAETGPENPDGKQAPELDLGNSVINFWWLVLAAAVAIVAAVFLLRKTLKKSASGN